MASVVPWVERYRPTRLDQVVGQPHVLEALSTFREQNNGQGSIPHLLFHGPPGTGKTSTINALVHELYGDHATKNVLCLNASHERGIGTVRTRIKEFVQRAKSRRVAFKMVVLDEADALSPDAQKAMRRLMEQYAAGTRICFLCNYLQTMIPALVSRCSVFAFHPLAPEHVKTQVARIAHAQQLDIDVDQVTRVCRGDLRAAVALIQSVKRRPAGTSVAEVAGYVPEPLLAPLLKPESREAARVALHTVLNLEGYAGPVLLHQLVTRWAETPDRVNPEVFMSAGTAELRLRQGADEFVQLLWVVSCAVE